MFKSFLERFSQPRCVCKDKHPERLVGRMVPTMDGDAPIELKIWESKKAPEFSRIDGCLYDLDPILKSGNTQLLEPCRNMYFHDAISVKAQFDAFKSKMPNLVVPQITENNG